MHIMKTRQQQQKQQQQEGEAELKYAAAEIIMPPEGSREEEVC